MNPQDKAQELLNIIESQDKLKVQINKIVEKAVPLKDQVNALSIREVELRKELAELMVSTNHEKITIDGTVITKKTTLNKVVVDDEDKVVLWIKGQKKYTNKEWIKTVEKLDTNKFKKQVQVMLAEDGEVEIDGVRVVDEHTIAITK